MTYKNKSFITKKKAFTLFELLIVIAIIGILFIVLVSKVDFATDKAKATGVQTDFRSFQLAFDTVAKENAGFNTFGWDTGDANQNGKRDSYDEGDNGAGGGTAKNGIQDGSEVFTGHKIYAETFTKVYSLKKNGTGDYDRDALNCLETAINANLDPKLHITIKDDGEIVMANGAQDPWNKEYHGWYITNAEVDGKDRGAIIMYSDGANNEFGSEHAIANGIVTISVPGSNKAGKDDYSIVSLYTYTNGYGEVKNITTGFSNNQTLGGNSVLNPTPGDDSATLPTPDLEGTVANSVSPIAYEWSELKALAQANLSVDELRDMYGIEVGDYKEVNGVKYVLVDLDGNDYDGFVFMYKADTTPIQMNTSAINNGGYVGYIESGELKTSNGKKVVDELYKNLTDTDLKNSIKKVTITCNSGDLAADGTDTNGMSTYTTDAYMFLASSKEVGFNFSGYQYAAEGSVFDYFSAGTNTARDNFAKLINLTNASSYWWLRSASSKSSTSFLIVSENTNGGGSNIVATATCVVAPAFVIG